MNSWKTIRPIFAMIVWLLCGVTTAPALAQTAESLDDEQPIALVADKVTFDSEGRTVTATGSVEVYYGLRTLTADKIVYDDNNGRIKAFGNLVLRDPTGTTVYADAADLDAELQDGLIEGARSLLHQVSKMSAVEARRVDGRFNTLSKAVYSPCEVCSDSPTPLWRIRARRVIHDEEEKLIHYENAYFDLFGLPILWLPYFQHPDPSVKRATGLLFPSYENSSIFGFGLRTPYFVVIDESRDFTITPFLTTLGGEIYEGEYRQAFDSGSLKVFGSITHDGNDTSINDDGGKTLRGHVDTEGRFLFGDNVEWGWDITATSDDRYLRRFDFDYPNRLNSEIYIEQYKNSSYFDVSGLYFQSLRSNEPTGQIPVGLPVFDARYDFDEDYLGGDLSLFTSGHGLRRNNGRDAARLTFGADWEREWLLSSGVALTGFAEVRSDFFSVRQDPTITQSFTPRLSGHIGFEARYPWIYTQESGASHIIEPIIQVIAAPYGGNGANIPYEDSLLAEFDETNVLDRNHFSGLDNFEDGPRLNVMVRYDTKLSEDIGLNASVGRVFRLEDNTAFSAGSGLRDAKGENVTAWNLDWGDYLTFSHRMRFGNETDVVRNEVAGILSVDPVALSARYVFFDADPDIQSPRVREELTASASWEITDNWRIAPFVRHDLEADELVNAGARLIFQNSCCKITLYTDRNFNNDEDLVASTLGGIQVELFTLGSGNGSSDVTGIDSITE